MNSHDNATGLERSARTFTSPASVNPYASSDSLDSGRLIHRFWKRREYLLLLVLVLGLLLANGLWLQQDRHVPDDDESGYLWTSLRLLDLFHKDGLKALPEALALNYYGRPILYNLITVPFQAVFGTSADVAVLLTNGLFLTTLILATYGIGKHLFDGRVGLLAACIVAASPPVVTLSRLYWTHLPLMAMCAVFAYLCLRSDAFSRWKVVILIGLSLAILALIRPMFPYYIAAVPFLVLAPALLKQLRPREREDDDSRLSIYGRVGLAALAVAIGLLLILPWYAQNLAQIRYMFTEVQEQSGPIAPLPFGGVIFATILWYVRDFPRSDSVWFAVLALIGIGLALIRFRRQTFFPLGWLFSSYVLLLFYPWKHFLVFMPNLVPLAVLAAFWIFQVRAAWLRRLMVAVVVVVVIASYLIQSWAYSPAMKTIGSKMGLYPAAGAIYGPPMDESAWAEAIDEAVSDMSSSWGQDTPMDVATLSWNKALAHFQVRYRAALRQLPTVRLHARWSGTFSDGVLLSDNYILTQRPVQGASIEDRKVAKLVDGFFVNPPEEFRSSHELLWRRTLPDGTIGEVYKRVRKVSPAEKIAVVKELQTLRQAEYADYLTLGQAYQEDGNLTQAVQVLKEAQAMFPSREGILISLGDVYRQQGEGEMALTVYQQALDLNSSSALAMTAIAQLYLSRDQAKESLPWVQRALRVEPAFVYAHSTLADIYKAMGNQDAAVAEYEKAYRLDPQNAGPIVQLAKAYYQWNQIPEAVAQYERAIQVDPQYAWAYCDLSRCYLDMKDVASAKTILEEGIRNNPEFPEGYISLGNIYLSEGDYPTAIGLFNRAMTADSRTTWAYTALANVYAKQGQLQAAVDVLEKATASTRDRSTAYRMLGDIRRRQGRNDDALLAYRKGIENNPQDATGYQRLADLLQNQDKYEEAIDLYRQALALRPDDITLHLALGQVHLAYHEARILPHQRDLALQEAETAIKIAPDSSPAHAFLGDVRSAQSLRTKAQESYRKALELAPDDVQVLIKLGVLFLQENDPDQAKEYFNRAKDLSAGQSWIRLSIASQYRTAGYFQAVVEEYRELVVLEPTDAVHRVRLGDAYRDAGQMDAAIVEWEEAFRLDPKYPDIHYKLGWAYEQKDWREKAIAEYRAHVAIGPIYQGDEKWIRASQERLNALSQ